jgi:hypothetical protein
MIFANVSLLRIIVIFLVLKELSLSSRVNVFPKEKLYHRRQSMKTVPLLIVFLGLRLMLRAVLASQVKMKIVLFSVILLIRYYTLDFAYVWMRTPVLSLNVRILSS